MDRRGAAGALLALAACVAYAAAAPTTNEHSALELYGGDAVEGCYYNFQHYSEGDRIMTNEPCLNCTCHNRMLMCYLRVCPFTKPIGHDCTVEKRADQCCPIVTCPHVPVDLLTSTEALTEYGATGVDRLEKYGCSVNGRYYSEGSKVPSTPNKPCEHCYCIRNMTTCVMQECTLHVDGCTPIYHKDVCCPVRYSCDHPEDEIPQLEDMTTTVRPTPGFILPTTVSSVTQECVHNDEIFADGALIKTEKACEHCYCMKGDIVCVVQECGTPMENEGKNCTSVPPRAGQCCPDTYICEGDNEIIEEQLTTLVPKTGEDDSEDKGEGSGQVEDDKKSELDENEGSGFGGISDSPIEKTSKVPEDIEISPTYTGVPATPSIIIDETKTDDQFFTTPSQDVRKPVITVSKTPEEKPTVEPDQGENTVPYEGLEEETLFTSQAKETEASSELPHHHEVESSTTVKSTIAEVELSKKPSSEKATIPYSAYSDIYTTDYTTTEKSTKGNALLQPQEEDESKTTSSPEIVSDISVHETSKTIIFDYVTEQNALPEEHLSTEFPHASIDSTSHGQITEASTVTELQTATETKPSGYTKEEEEIPGKVDENIIEEVTSIVQQITTEIEPGRHAEEKEKLSTTHLPATVAFTSFEQQTTTETEPNRQAEEKETPSITKTPIIEAFTTIEQQTTTETDFVKYAEEEKKPSTTLSPVTEASTSIELQVKTESGPVRSGEGTEISSTTHGPILEASTSVEIQATIEKEPSSYAQEDQKPQIISEDSSTKIVLEELTTESHTTNVPETIFPGIIPGEGSCLVDGTTYENQSIIPVRNKCQESCKCMSSIVKCEMIQCSPPPENMINCVPEYDSEDTCCPTYTCDHAKETIPPQPHSQMSATEKTPIEEVCDENCIKETKETLPTCEGTDCGSNIVPIEEENVKPIKSSELCSAGQCNISEVSTTQENKPCSTQDCVSQSEPLCTGDSCEFSSVKPPEILETPGRKPVECEDSSCDPSTDQQCVEGVNCKPTEIPHITCEDEDCISKVEKKPCEGESECDYSKSGAQVPTCEGESCVQSYPGEQPHTSSTECKSQDCISPSQAKPDSAVRKEDSCDNGQDCKPTTSEENEIPVEECKGNDCFSPDSDKSSATVQSYTMPDEIQYITTIAPKLVTTTPREQVFAVTSNQPIESISSDSDQLTESIYDTEASTKIAETQAPELEPILVEKTTLASLEYSSKDITFSEPEQTTKTIDNLTPDMSTPTDKRTSEASAPTEAVVEPEKSTETVFSVETETERSSQKTDSFMPETGVTQETMSTLRPVQAEAVDANDIETEKSTERVPEIEVKIDTYKNISTDTITSTEFIYVGEPETDISPTLTPEIKLTGSSHISEPELDKITEKYEISTEKFGVPTDSVPTSIVDIKEVTERFDTSFPETEASVTTLSTTKPIMDNLTETSVTLAPEGEISTQKVLVSTTDIIEFTEIPSTTAPKIDTTQHVSIFVPENEKSTEGEYTPSENIDTSISETESEKSPDVFAPDVPIFEKSTESTILSTEPFTHIIDTSVPKEEYSTESGHKSETESVEFAEVTDVPHSEIVRKPSIEAQLSTKTIEEVSESSSTVLSEFHDSTEKDKLSKPSIQSSTEFINYTDFEITTEIIESPVTQKSSESDEISTLEREVTTTPGSKITSEETAHSELTAEITTKSFDHSTKILYTSPPDSMKPEETSAINTSETEEFIKFSDVSSPAAPTEPTALLETDMTTPMFILQAEKEHITEEDKISEKTTEPSLIAVEDTEKPTVDRSTDKTEVYQKETEYPIVIPEVSVLTSKTPLVQSADTEQPTVDGIIATTESYKRKPEYPAVEDGFTTSPSEVLELQTTKEPAKIEILTDEYKVPVTSSETTEFQKAETEVPPISIVTGKIDYSSKVPEYPAHGYETPEITSKTTEIYIDNTEESTPEKSTEETETEYPISVHEMSVITSETPEVQSIITEHNKQPDSFEKRPEYTTATEGESVTTNEIPAIPSADTEKVIIDTRKPDIPISESDEGDITTITPAIEKAPESAISHTDLEKATESALDVSESLSQEKLEPEITIFKDKGTTSYVAVTTSIEKVDEKATDVLQSTTEVFEFVREETTLPSFFSSSESTVNYELERKPTYTEKEKPVVPVSDFVEKATESFVKASEQTNSDLETTTPFMVELEEHPHKPLQEISTHIPDLHKVTNKQKEDSETRRPIDDETLKLSTEMETEFTPSPEIIDVTGGAHEHSVPEADSKEQHTTSKYPSHVILDENIVYEHKDEQSTLSPEIIETVTPSDVTAVESDASTLPVLDSKKETPSHGIRNQTQIIPTEKVSLGPDYQTTEQEIYIKEHDRTEKITTLSGEEHTTESKEPVVFDEHMSTVAQEKLESSTQSPFSEQGSKDITEIPFEVASKTPEEENEYTLVPQITLTSEETTLKQEEDYLSSSTTKPDSVVSVTMSHKEQITTSIPIEQDLTTTVYDGVSASSSTESEQIPGEPIEEQRKPIVVHVETTLTPIERKPTAVDKETSISTTEEPAVPSISESAVEPVIETSTHLTEETEKTTVSEEPEINVPLTEKVPISNEYTIATEKPEGLLVSGPDSSTEFDMELSTEKKIIMPHSEGASEPVTDAPHTTSQKEILMESTESLSDSSSTSIPLTVSHDITITTPTVEIEEQYSKTTPEIKIKETAHTEIPLATDKLATDESESFTEIPEILTTPKIQVVHEEHVRKPTQPPTTTTTESEQMLESSTETAIDKEKPEQQATSSPTLEEVAKPDKTQPATSSELPSPTDDIDHQMQDHFPPSGGGTYGTDPDYGEDDQAFGPGTCRYGGKVYVSAQQIPRDDPCDFCFCFRSDIICLQQSCPPPIHGCHEEPIEGFCCPRYECPVSMATSLNVTTTTTTTTTTLPPHFLPHAYKGAAQKRGCQIKGHSYNVGEVIKSSSGPCLHCTCGGDGQMKCDPKACTPEPMLRQMIAAAVSSKRRR